MAGTNPWGSCGSYQPEPGLNPPHREHGSEARWRPLPGPGSLYPFIHAAPPCIHRASASLPALCSLPPSVRPRPALHSLSRCFFTSPSSLLPFLHPAALHPASAGQGFPACRPQPPSVRPCIPPRPAALPSRCFRPEKHRARGWRVGEECGEYSNVYVHYMSSCMRSI